MRKLLSRLLAKFSKKEEPPVVEAPLVASEPEELGYKPYYEIMHDEETGMTIVAYIICACQTQTRLLVDGVFDCPHCDRPCKLEVCELCTRLQNFTYDMEYEEEDDDDADL